MIVKMKKTKKKKPEIPPLTLPEKEVVEAIGEILDENGGRIPALAEIVEKINGRVKATRVCEIRSSLEKKGYYWERAGVRKPAQC